MYDVAWKMSVRKAIVKVILLMISITTFTSHRNQMMSFFSHVKVEKHIMD
jgi:hypothetical protein